MLLSSLAWQHYWMGCHLQRAEDCARIALAHQRIAARLPGNSPPLLQEFLKGFENSPAEADDQDACMRHMMSSRSNALSVVAQLEMIDHNIRTVRGLMPSDAWARVRDLKEQSIGLVGVGRTAMQNSLERFIRGSLALAGVISTGMLRGEGYQFWQIGRQLAGAEMTCGIVSAAMRCQADEQEDVYFDSLIWSQVLKAMGMLEAYRMSTHEPVTNESSAVFLVQEVRAPRSVEACLVKASIAAGVLPGNSKPLRALSSSRQLVESFRRKHASSEVLERLAARIEAAMVAVAKNYFPTL